MVVLLLIVVLAFAFYKPLPQTAMPTSTVTMMPPETKQASTPTQTAIQSITTTAQPQFDVVIMYTEKYSDERVGRSQPEPGFTFLVLTLKIQNNIGGYRVDPTYFHVTVNGVKYDLDPATYSLPDALQYVELQSGGSISGSMVFQVPAGSVSYTPTYEPPFRPVTIGWIHY